MTNPPPRTAEDTERVTPIAMKLYPRVIEILGLSHAESDAILALLEGAAPGPFTEDQLLRISYMIGIEQRLESLTLNSQIDLSPAEWMHEASSVDWMDRKTPAEYLAVTDLDGFQRLRDHLDTMMH